MANIVTENVLLMVPVFFAIMIFGLLATNVTMGFSEQQRKIIVESHQGKLTSTIQQLYYIMKEQQVQNCTVTLDSPLPSLIDGQNYRVNANETSGVLSLTFYFPGIDTEFITKVPLGSHYTWDAASTLVSDGVNPGIRVTKAGEELAFSFK